jgi:hypothetical protein
MKPRRLLPLLVVVVLSLLFVSIALAFGMGNVDGVWGYVNGTVETQYGSSAVNCSRWATGPGDSPTSISNWNTAIQGALGGTDENQVRYGSGDNISGCSNYQTPAGFAYQSGLGFDGRNSVGAPLAAGTPFWVGRLTHYNNPIQNYTSWAISLTVSIGGIVCGNGLPPNEGSAVTFTVPIAYVETNNCPSGSGCTASGTDCSGAVAACPYGPSTPGWPGGTACPYQSGDTTGLNRNGCADSVSNPSIPTLGAFTCDDANEPSTTKGVWHVTILGWQPHTSNDCSTQTYNASALNSSFFTAETLDNNACLWAQTSLQPTAVDLKSFTAAAQNKAITLGWESVSEADNLGFNVYRAAKLDGERTKINAEMILSGVNPGSPSGAVYEYTDTSLEKLGTYYYWVEDVQISGNTGLHGPVEASLAAKPLIKVPEFKWPLNILPPAEESSTDGPTG